MLIVPCSPLFRCSWSSYKVDHKRDKIGVFVSTVSTKIPFKVTVVADCCSTKIPFKVIAVALRYLLSFKVTVVAQTYRSR